MTQRAKLRRLAFIDLPSWSRGSRPYFLGQARGESPKESPSRLRYNLGAGAVAAKGTSQDYLAHPSVIPVQIMAWAWVFAGVVKRHGGFSGGLRPQSVRRRRGGAGAMVSR